MPRPTDGAVHAALQRDVEAFAASLGYLKGEMTYHDEKNESIPPEVRRRLQRIDTLPALAIRNHSDKFFVHRQFDSVFECEYKGRNSVKKYDHRTRTHYWNGKDALCEASQFAFNCYRTLSGARVLYCYRNPDLGLDVGFWCSKETRSQIREIHWPVRWELNEDLKAMVRRVFPKASVIPVGHTRGSGDPYVIIPYDFLVSCRHWRDEIVDQLARDSEPAVANAVNG